MSSETDDGPRSSKRKRLCSRANADRVALQLCHANDTDTAVVRTGDGLQPYRVVSAADAPAHLTELEIRIL